MNAVIQVHAEVVRPCGNVAVVMLSAFDLFSNQRKAEVLARVVARVAA